MFLQDEVRRGRPYSVPGKVVSIRDHGLSAFVWCPGKARRLLRNRRKMRLRMDDDEDDEEGEESSDEEEMIDEVEEDLVDDELHDALSVGALLPTGTHAAVHQVTSADAQLPSALRAVQTTPRPAQLTAGGERVPLVWFTLECFHRRNLRAGDQLCPGLVTNTGKDYLCCCEQNTVHKL